ncbi:hypothetical protein ACQ4WX_40970 [Streptomyces lasalocidi]
MTSTFCSGGARCPSALAAARATWATRPVTAEERGSGAALSSAGPLPSESAEPSPPSSAESPSGFPAFGSPSLPSGLSAFGSSGFPSGSSAELGLRFGGFLGLA